MAQRVPDSAPLGWWGFPQPSAHNASEPTHRRNRHVGGPINWRIRPPSVLNEKPWPSRTLAGRKRLGTAPPSYTKHSEWRMGCGSHHGFTCRQCRSTERSTPTGGNTACRWWRRWTRRGRGRRQSTEQRPGQRTRRARRFGTGCRHGKRSSCSGRNGTPRRPEWRGMMAALQPF